MLYDWISEHMNELEIIEWMSDHWISEELYEWNSDYMDEWMVI